MRQLNAYTEGTQSHKHSCQWINLFLHKIEIIFSNLSVPFSSIYKHPFKGNLLPNIFFQHLESISEHPKYYVQFSFHCAIYSILLYWQRDLKPNCVLVFVTVHLRRVDQWVLEDSISDTCCYLHHAWKVCKFSLFCQFPNFHEYFTEEIDLLSR